MDNLRHCTEEDDGDCMRCTVCDDGGNQSLISPSYFHNCLNKCSKCIFHVNNGLNAFAYSV